MNSRDQILKNIRGANLSKTEHPGHYLPANEYSDLITTFSESLELAGGKSFLCDDFSQIDKLIKELYPNQESILDLTDLNLKNSIAKEDIHDGHQLEELQLCITKGHFAIAENGAIWIHHSDFKHRSALFICQHLIIILDRRKILHTMHDAFDHLDFSKPGYGVFISGPSKTADIEQSLVIGAHGPRSCSVILV